MPPTPSTVTVLVVGADATRSSSLARRIYGKDGFVSPDGIDAAALDALGGGLPATAPDVALRALQTLGAAAAAGDAGSINELFTRFGVAAVITVADDKALASVGKDLAAVELGPLTDLEKIVLALTNLTAKSPGSVETLDLTTDPPPTAGAPKPEKPQVLDLARKDEPVSLAPLIVEGGQSIQLRREQVRGAIAILLIAALILTIVTFLLGDMFDRPIDGNKFNLCLTALVSLVGAAMGFYFGTEAKK